LLLFTEQRRRDFTCSLPLTQPKFDSLG